MKLSDLLTEAIDSIFSNKVRSGLTLLGIVIGIGSVIGTISIGQGAKSSIESNIQSLGSNLIIVIPGAQRTFSTMAASRGTAQTLTLDDAKAIEKEISDINGVAPIVQRNYQVIAKNKNTRTQIVGTNSFYQKARNVQLEYGSFFTEKDNENLSKVAVLGALAREDLFGSSSNPIGQYIRIQGMNFKVIGVAKEKGGFSVMEDDAIFIPISVAQKFLTGNEYLSSIAVQTKDENSISNVKEEIYNLLIKRHNIKSPDLVDFTIFTQADMLTMASSITNTMTILLASIASISLIVGGIGIMNMMFTAVTERTKEIGLRKAIGAKRKDITLQFLSESIMLTFLGGFFGIILGWLLSLAIYFFGGINTKISLSSIFLAFGVSAGIGILFGYWPAQKAAKLNPIEAIRYE
jgi:ABC-type antimicrobial peptide transport system permease subunit